MDSGGLDDFEFLASAAATATSERMLSSNVTQIVNGSVTEAADEEEAEAVNVALVISYAVLDIITIVSA